MDKELKQLLKYCKDNDIKVVFTDSTILTDYAALNPEAAKVMGFPDIDNNPRTKEILIDETLPEEAQTQNLKHELIEMRLMQNGMEYWDAHTIALAREKQPFNFSRPMSVKQEINTIPVEEHRWGHEESEKQKPKKKGKSLLAHLGIVRAK